MKASSPSIFNGNPPYSGNKTLSPTDTVIGIFTPSLVVKPGPTAKTSPSFAFEMFASGNIIPPGVYSKNNHNQPIVYKLIIPYHQSMNQQNNQPIHRFINQSIKFITFVTGNILLIRTRSAKGISLFKVDYSR
jgi:hypothetical protein